jgi:predicted permease
MSSFDGIRRWFHLDRPVQDEVDEELAFHFQRTIEELVAAGMHREAAQAEARRRFGDLQGYRRQLRQIGQHRRTERRRTEYLVLLSRNLRLAWRGIRRNPGFAFVVALTMGLGIGINSSMFALLDRLLFTPPAQVRDADRVRRIYVTRSPQGQWIYQQTVSYPDVVDLKHGNSFEPAAAYANAYLPLGHGESGQRIPVSLVEPGWFEILGVRPVIGRLLEAADDSAAGGLANVMISYGLWQRQFGGASTVLGQTVELGVGRYTIVGVTPEGFGGLEAVNTDAWLPLTPGSAEVTSEQWKANRGDNWVRAITRLTPGAGVARAEAEATALHLAGRSEDTAYASRQHAHLTFGPLLEARGPAAGDDARVYLWAAGVSLAVLLVACANVANLLLFRAIRRRREIAVRLALGVSRAQLLSQLLVESLLLALIGGCGALLLAFFGSTLLRGLLTSELAHTVTALSWRVAGFTLLAAVASGLIAGLIPAWLESRPDLLSALKESTSGTGGHHYIRSGLVVLQTALSVTLLVGAGLFLLSFFRIRAIDMGVQADQVLVVNPSFPSSVPTAERLSFYQSSAERLRHVPGVQSVAVSTAVPFQVGWSEQVTIPGFDTLPSVQTGGPYVDGVSAGYFETMGIRILKGRGFQETDVAGGELVVVMGETMARVLWPNDNPLGKCLKMGDATAPCRTIVGIAHDTQRDIGMMRGNARMQYYIPLPQTPLVPPSSGRVLMVRAPQSLMMVGAVREMLFQLQPGLRFIETRTFEQVYTPSFQSWKSGAALFTAFGGLALLVAAVGLYSLLSYGVAQRTREIGVRMALGARPATVVQLVLQQGVTLVLGGVAIGLSVALLAARATAPLLFRTTPTEPGVYLGVAAVLLIIAILAGTFPAWSATRVSPMTALRAE